MRMHCWCLCHAGEAKLFCLMIGPVTSNKKGVADLSPGGVFFLV